MGSFFELLGNLITGIFPTNRLGKIVTLALVFGVIVVGFLAYESMTGDFTLGRLEKKIDLLASLYELEKDGINNSPKLASAYGNLVTELKGYNPSLIPSDLRVNFFLNPDFWQFLGGFALFGVAAIYYVTDKKTSKMTVLVSLMVGGVLGLIFAWTPDSPNNFVNFFLPLVIELVFLFGLSKLQSKKQADTPVTT